MVNKRMDLVYIIRTMQKMMASISVLIKEHPTKIMHSIRTLNVNKQTIWDRRQDSIVYENEEKKLEDFLEYYDYLDGSDEDEAGPLNTMGSVEADKDKEKE